MDNFRRYLEYQRDLAESALKVINKHLSNSYDEPAKQKRTYKLKIVEKILHDAKRPMHIQEIIETARVKYGVELERDSMVSALVKKVKVGQLFARTAPNTFSLIDGGYYD